MENKPLKHIQDNTPPAWTVDWGYDGPRHYQHYQEEKSWYLGFKSEEDAREFAAWYLKDQEHRIYPGSVKLHTKE
jgi:hypothetical protein